MDASAGLTDSGQLLSMSQHWPHPRQVKGQDRRALGGQLPLRAPCPARAQAVKKGQEALGFAPAGGAAPAPGVLPYLPETPRHGSEPWPGGTSEPPSQAAGCHRGTAAQSPPASDPSPMHQGSLLGREKEAA